MYEQYQGLIFDIDDALLDTGTNTPKMSPYGMRMQFDEAAVVSFNCGRLI